MEKMVANILETAAAAVCFGFLLRQFWDFLLAISSY